GRGILVSRPTHLDVAPSSIETIRVQSALQRLEAGHRHYAEKEVDIWGPAVADFRTKAIGLRKPTKGEGGLRIELEPNPDILQSLGEIKTRQFLVGFALETENALENAKGKLRRKNLDAIVLNTLEDPGAGFGPGSNKITYIDKKLEI